MVVNNPLCTPRLNRLFSSISLGLVSAGIGFPGVYIVWVSDCLPEIGGVFRWASIGLMLAMYTIYVLHQFSTDQHSTKHVIHALACALFVGCAQNAAGYYVYTADAQFLYWGDLSMLIGVLFFIASYCNKTHASAGAVVGDAVKFKHHRCFNYCIETLFLLCAFAWIGILAVTSSDIYIERPTTGECS